MTKHNKITKAVFTVLVACLAFMAVCLPAFATQPDEGDADIIIGSNSFILEYPLPGTEFSVYKVADFRQPHHFTLTPAFAVYAEEISELKNLETIAEPVTASTWVNLAGTLEGYVTAKAIPADRTATTDGDGMADFHGLDNGLYLVLGQVSETDGESFTPSPVLLTLPAKDAGGIWQGSVVVDYSGKAYMNGTSTSCSVQKIWVDSGYENKRPRQITVDLYKAMDSTPYDSVVLSQENNWKHTWSGLPAGNKWIVAEREIPAGYKVRYTQDTTLYIVENTYDAPAPRPTPPPSKPSDPATPPPAPVPPVPELPDTGQLWWPVPFMMIAGILLFVMGWLRRNSGEDQP